VLADGVVVGRIMKTEAAPVGSPWMWTLAFGHHGSYATPALDRPASSIRQLFANAAIASSRVAA